MLRFSSSAALLAVFISGCTPPRTQRVQQVERAPAWSAPALEQAVVVRDGRSGEPLELDDLLDRLAGADVVFLGESHTDETTHRFELAVYEGLLARREGRVVLALEMFERDVQPALDAYFAGTIDEKTLLGQARPWSNYRTAYRPLIERARLSGAPVVASNFPAPLRQRLAQQEAEGFAQLTSEQRQQAPEEVLANTPAYWRRVDNAIRGHAGMTGPPPAADDPRLFDTQSLWDNSMGESCARALARHPGWLVLHVNGGFHSAYWDGTVRQLRLRRPDARVLTVDIEPSANPATETPSGVPRADYIAYAEARASDIDDGAFAVVVSRELKYRLHWPMPAGGPAAMPLLIWLGDDGVTARESLADWKGRLGETCAVAVIEAPYRETQDDGVEGGRWFWPDSFDQDILALHEGIQRMWGYLHRHYDVDPARVCLAGEGTGATVVAAVSMLTASMDVQAVALFPERYVKIKDFPLPLPELLGDSPRPVKSLRILAPSGDQAWWAGEVDAYHGVGFDCTLVTAGADPWLDDVERENAVRSALGVAPLSAPSDAPRRYVLAEGSRARDWARRTARRRLASAGELAAVLPAPPEDSAAQELVLTVQPSDFQSDRPLPRCPGPFGGTTVVVVPAELPAEQAAAWLALEQSDPLAQRSRFHRLRIATASPDRALPQVLAQLLEQGRKNVLIVPAVFCADGAAMGELRRSAARFEDRMTLHWQPGLGSAGE
jgi:uncharacterized iron-regulated protein